MAFNLAIDLTPVPTSTLLRLGLLLLLACNDGADGCCLLLLGAVDACDEDDSESLLDDESEPLLDELELDDPEEAVDDSVELAC